MKHRLFKSACDLVISEIPAQRKAGGAQRLHTEENAVLI